jgi:drug/metabolite transporter (DMT)-like permease
MAQDNRAKGLVITLAGVLVITPDALLVRLIAADEWTVLFWRGLLSGLAILAGLGLLHRRRLPRQLRTIGKTGVWLAVLFSAGTVLFIISVSLTTVANTLFIVSTAPLFAAIIARVFLGEAVPPRTWAAIGCALFGIGVIASGSAGQGSGSLLGDLAALGIAVSMAGTFSLARKERANSMVPAMALSGFITAFAVLPLAAPFEFAARDPVYLGLMGLVVIPLGFSLITLGPRYLPAPEVSLLLLLEAVLGPLWVWLALDEDPGAATLVGGFIVIATLAASNLGSLRAQPTRS